VVVRIMGHLPRLRWSKDLTSHLSLDSSISSTPCMTDYECSEAYWSRMRSAPSSPVHIVPEFQELDKSTLEEEANPAPLSIPEYEYDDVSFRPLSLWDPWWYRPVKWMMGGSVRYL